MKNTLVYVNTHRGSLIELWHGNRGRQAIVVYLGRVSNSYLVDRIIIRETTGKCIETVTGSGAFSYAMNIIS